MANIYKVNQAIDVVYGAVGAQTGLIDLKLIATDPSGTDDTPITMTEVSNGLYKATFTPDENGRWRIRITSISAPENGVSAYYWVGNYDTVEAQPFILVDSDGHEADVTPNGRLLVSTQPPAAPPSTTRIVKTKYSSLKNSDDDVWTIPNGETITLQRLSAGAEAHKDHGSNIELWYDPNGTGSGMTILDVIFCNGTSDQHDLNDIFTGDGTKAIRMRRNRLGGGKLWIFARWEGYY